jgi:hypothetical protein
MGPGYSGSRRAGEGPARSRSLALEDQEDHGHVSTPR